MLHCTEFRSFKLDSVSAAEVDDVAALNEYPGLSNLATTHFESDDAGHECEEQCMID